MALRRREDLEAREGRDAGKRARQGASSALYTVLVVAAMIAVLALSMAVRGRWDMSRSGANTLSPRTREVLRDLKEDVLLTALFTDDSRVQQRRDAYWLLLQLYRDASSRVKVEFVDPVAQPGKLAELGLTASERSARREGSTVVRRGTRRIVFTGTDEADVTNALLEVGSDRSKVVGFLRGVAERDPGSAAVDGLGSLAEALRSEYYEVVDVPAGVAIPADLSALVVAGPRAPIPEPALQALSAWMERGGRLLVLLDPGFDPGLVPLLESWGLRPLWTAVSDPVQNVNGQPAFLKASQYSAHPVVKGFGAAFPAALPLAMAVEDFDPGRPALRHELLVRSGPRSEGITEDGRRIPGPFILAAASWMKTDDPPGGETRVVLIGDSDLASNEYLPAFANRNLLLNAVAWLARVQELMAVRTDPMAGRTIEMEAGDRPVLYAAVLGVPVLVLLAGLVVFARRRGL